MKKKIISFLVCFSMLFALALNIQTVDAVDERITVSLQPLEDSDPFEEMAEGKEVWFILTITNNGEKDLTITSIEHYYAAEWSEDEYDVLSFGELFDGGIDGEELPEYYGETPLSQSIAAGETLTFGVLGYGIRDFDYEKSAVVISVLADDDNGISYYGGCIYPERSNETNKATINLINTSDDVDITDKILADTVLSEEELDDGYSYTVVFNSDIVDDDNIGEEIKNQVESALDTKEVALVLDLSITKEKYDNDELIDETAVSSLSSSITLTINIPEEYIDKNREFSVLRVHEDTVDELKDLDDDPNTVTIETDRFSYYYLVYTQTNKDDEVITPTKNYEIKVTTSEGCPTIEIKNEDWIESLDKNYSYTFELIGESLDEEKVNSEAKKSLENSLNSRHIACGLYLQLIKKGWHDDIQGDLLYYLDTGVAVNLKIDIPEEYRVEGRKFSVLLLTYDGKLEELEDLDDDPNTVTINTTRFSSNYYDRSNSVYYYLVYTDNEDDVKVEETNQNKEESKSTDNTDPASVQTGDETNALIYFIGMAGMLVLAGFVFRRIKE